VRRNTSAPRTISFWLLLAAMLLSTLAPARALNLSALYSAQAVVTGADERNRQPGFEDCLRRVLVKVSGDPTVLDDPALTAALPRAGGFIATYRYRDRMEGIPIHDEQGTHDRPHDLYCSFDRERIDAFLQKLGRKPWLEERPRLIVFLAVRQADKSFVLSRNGADGVYMRQSLAAAGEPLGLPADLPDAATLASAALNADTLPKVDMTDLAAIANRYDGAAALAGSLSWSDEDRGWVAQWRLQRDDVVYEWRRRGISFDDAFRNALAGGLQVLSGNGQPR
jgi:hypothetical protein